MSKTDIVAPSCIDWDGMDGYLDGMLIISSKAQNVFKVWHFGILRITTTSFLSAC